MPTKLDKLKKLLKNYRSVLVCYSGGVDSTFLLKVAIDTLGPKRAVGLIARSDFYPDEMLDDAVKLGRSLGAEIIEVEVDVFKVKNVAKNPPDRCYHCKKGMLGLAKKIAARRGLDRVIDGTNASDLGDYRPGMKAVGESGASSPLLEAGFTKDEIRAESKKLALKTWNKKSYTCLATRFPAGVKITPENVRRIAAIERAISREKFGGFRVRYHGGIVRIELDPKDFARFVKPGVRDRIAKAVHAAGFRFATLDIDGYRTGSMNIMKNEK